MIALKKNNGYNLKGNIRGCIPGKTRSWGMCGQWVEGALPLIYHPIDNYVKKVGENVVHFQRIFSQHSSKQTEGNTNAHPLFMLKWHSRQMANWVSGWQWIYMFFIECEGTFIQLEPPLVMQFIIRGRNSSPRKSLHCSILPVIAKFHVNLWLRMGSIRVSLICCCSKYGQNLPDRSHFFCLHINCSLGNGLW